MNKSSLKTIAVRVISMLVFVGLVVGFILAEGRLMHTSSNRWDNYYAEDNDTIDVVCIGSSAMYRYWIPPQAYEEQGFTSFLIASPAQPFAAVPYIMEEAEKTQSPRLIVVEVRNAVARTAADMDGDVDMADIEAQRTYYLSEVVSGMRTSLTKLRLIGALLKEDEYNTRLTWSLPLLRYHDTELTMSADERIKRLNNDKNKYKSATQTDAHKAIKEPVEYETVTGYITEEEEKSIDAVVSKAKELDTQLLMLSTPYRASKTRYALQKGMEKYMEEMNYPYLSLYGETEEVGLDYSSDFYNNNHVNILGGQKVTKYVGDYISENYEIGESELDEKNNAEWANASEDWAKKSDEMIASCMENMKQSANGSAEK